MGRRVTLSDPDTSSATSGAITTKTCVGMGFIVSRLNYPVELSYDGKAVMMPPRGRLNCIEKNKVGTMPPGITFIEKN